MACRHDDRRSQASIGVDTMNEQELKQRVWQALKRIPYPGYTRDIVSFGLVERVHVEGRQVTVSLMLSHLPAERQEEVMRLVQEALGALPDDVMIRVEHATRQAVSVSQDPSHARPPTVRRVLAVGSGKGGVGKSTVSVNLAVALARLGVQVGLLDADVYGPNVPRMMGVDTLPPRRQRGRIPTAEAYGVRLISVGFMVQPNQAIAWRGPMTDKLIRQFLADVEWGDLDVLVVDLPPGTGDIAMALAKYGRPEGALLVVTPQAVAWDDALKAATMFHKLDIPLLGFVENMAYFVCDECGKRHLFFPQNRPAPEVLGGEWQPLAQLPFDPALAFAGDTGRPVAADENSPLADAFIALARRVALRLDLPLNKNAEEGAHA